MRQRLGEHSVNCHYNVRCPSAATPWESSCCRILLTLFYLRPLPEPWLHCTPQSGGMGSLSAASGALLWGLLLWAGVLRPGSPLTPGNSASSSYLWSQQLFCTHLCHPQGQQTFTVKGQMVRILGHTVPCQILLYFLRTSLFFKM